MEPTEPYAAGYAAAMRGEEEPGPVSAGSAAEAAWLRGYADGLTDMAIAEWPR